MAKQLTFESDAREAVLRGVSKLAKAVTSTLGPRGRNAVLDKGWGGPRVETTALASLEPASAPARNSTTSMTWTKK